MAYKDPKNRAEYLKQYNLKPEVRERKKLWGRQYRQLHPRKKISVDCSVCGQSRELTPTQISSIKHGKSKNICRPCSVRITCANPDRKLNRTITWGNKIREAQLRSEYRLRRIAPYRCKGCGKSENGYTKIQQYCSNRCKYDARSDDPLKKKAFVLGANLRMGKGKMEFLIKLLNQCLNSPCVYCGVLLTLENCNLDHKKPYADSKIRRYAPASVKRHFDKPDNLQLICKECNSFKGELEDVHFRVLLKFLNAHPVIAAYVKKRMARGNLMWKFRAKAGEKRIA